MFQNKSPSTMACESALMVSDTNPHRTSLRGLQGVTRVYQYLIGSRAIIRESNGTPLQSSCLENPMDGEAW